ncbi:MAG: hypothetical protein HKO03_04185 [Acidimicrobiia bacterium]|nr:hypothetical protein [Acidimicrobiia bacterium]
MARLLMLLAMTSLIFGACSGNSVSTDEFRELQNQLATVSNERSQAMEQNEILQDELVLVTAERDDLAEEKRLAEQRFVNSSVSAERTGLIVSDPASYGSEEEVLDQLMEYVAPGAVIHDLAYGIVETRQGWFNTLFREAVDAETYVWHKWMCSDGSQGGSLWTWRGTNVVGEPFELIGISLSDYDQEGLETRQTVAWPYEHQQVYTEFGVGP